jgi:hypothetical protein
LAIYFILGWSVYRHWSWRAGKYLGLMWLVCLPAFLHNFSLYMRDGVWRQWQTQSPPPTPPPADFILGYGFLLALATVGGYAILRQNHSRQTCQAVVLVVWIISVFILLFAPIPPLEAIQVRFSEGLHIPIAILATEGLFAIFANMAGGKVPQKRVWVPLLILLSLTNWLILVSAIWRVNIPESPWFYTQDEVVAMRWLDNHSQPTDVVLTLDWTGNYLPAQANVHVYVGHLYETIDFSKKVEQAAAFFSNSVSEVEAANFLKENNIGWVFVGHQESDSAFNPGRITCLKKAFEHGAVSVYRVNLP